MRTPRDRRIGIGRPAGVSHTRSIELEAMPGL
jgi:hypothetical protein